MVKFQVAMLAVCYSMGASFLTAVPAESLLYGVAVFFAVWSFLVYVTWRAFRHEKDYFDRFVECTVCKTVFDPKNKGMDEDGYRLCAKCLRAGYGPFKHSTVHNKP